MNKNTLDLAYCIHVQSMQQKEAAAIPFANFLSRLVAPTAAATRSVGIPVLDKGLHQAAHRGVAGKAIGNAAQGLSDKIGPITPGKVGKAVAYTAGTGATAAGITGLYRARDEADMNAEFPGAITSEQADALVSSMNKADQQASAPPAPKKSPEKPAGETASRLGSTLTGAAAGGAVLGGSSMLYGRLKQLPSRKRDILLALLGAGAGAAVGYGWNRGDATSTDVPKNPTK